MLIFGGSSGIGKTVAVGAAQQGAARIWIVGRDEAKLAEATSEIERAASASCTVSGASVDTMDEAAVRAFVDALDDDSVDHLVTTPGGSARLGNLVENKRTCDDVRRQMDLKFYAQLAPVLAIGDKIRAGGSVTMTSGVLSRRMGRGNDALVVANAAIEAMVKTLACSWGYEQKRVRVNCLSPGMTMTPVYAGADGQVDPAILAYQQKTAEAVPLQRNGQPEEMAHAIFQLQTNTFITGVVLDVDGGNIVKM